MEDNTPIFFRWNQEIVSFVNKLKAKYENSIRESQFDVQKNISELIEKIASDMINEIDNRYNSDMKMFKTINECFKQQSKIYHAFVDFLHDFATKNGINSLFFK